MKGVGGRVGEETMNIFAHHRNSEGQMFESFKTPETGICYSGQWQQGLSVCWRAWHALGHHSSSLSLHLSTSPFFIFHFNLYSFRVVSLRDSLSVL